MQPTINIVTLGTKDINLATKFYQDGLGFPRMDFAGEVAFFTLNGSWLALYPWHLLAVDAEVKPDGSGFRGVTLAHNAKSEEEVLAILKQAESSGAQIKKPGTKTSWGGFSGYFADLDGHLWEVAYNPFFWPGPK